ncbi:hypothetical protein SRABI84_05245 [Peribacillus simplex]|uniref:hypothetical protein n=1 Tax=Peribacillus simplex TaxID=1478 RepID=UPI0011DCEDC9|nr:hypothetical protein [Peribacillus simplex]CAH0320563.1 hypothetical protein SRABI84_05245 [Peribacillus simplex]
MGDNVFIPNPPDVVTILWERSPFEKEAPRTIREATVIGSANPCQKKLVPGKRFNKARSCLLENGFEEIVSDSFFLHGISVFVRVG